MDFVQAALDHLKCLIRIDTSNPPGNEMAALQYLQGTLEAEGLGVFIQPTAPHRGNLVVRLKGDGSEAPLLISSHVDVVTVEREHWKHDPFAAVEEDGCVYGRGAIDMKHFTAMCVTTIIRAHHEQWNLKRDVIMAAVSDEETGSAYGMARLVRDHPELIKAEYAIGEVGACTAYLGGNAIYPIQAGEKGTLGIEAVFKGEPGHGSLPRAENAHWQVAKFLSALERGVFPYHGTRAFEGFVHGVKKAFGVIRGLPVGLLCSPLAPTLLKHAAKKGNVKAAALLAMMTNTVNPTGIHSGTQHNVVPSTVQVNLDCRVIPGQTPEDVLREIRDVTGFDLAYRVLYQQDGHECPVDTPLFKLLCTKLEEAHPGAVAAPWLTVGRTDASELRKLGIHCYGFTPVKLDPGLDFATLYHGHNERIPVEGFTWGLEVFSNTVKAFCCH